MKQEEMSNSDRRKAEAFDKLETWAKNHGQVTIWQDPQGMICCDATEIDAVGDTIYVQDCCGDSLLSALESVEK
jgi:hypothetical protein